MLEVINEEYSSKLHNVIQFEFGENFSLPDIQMLKEVFLKRPEVFGDKTFNIVIKDNFKIGTSLIFQIFREIGTLRCHE